MAERRTSRDVCGPAARRGSREPLELIETLAQILFQCFQ